MKQFNEFSVGPISGMLKPKYRVISAILGEGFTANKGMDVFIDLNTFVTALSTSQKFLNSIPFSEKVETDLVSSVLYTIKHWKDFVKKWDDVRIILFVNDFEMAMLAEQDSVNSYLYPYINKFQNDRFKQFVYYWGEAMKKIDIVLKFIPSVYLIRCNRFDSYVVPNLLDDYSERQRIIISGNPLMTNYHYMKNTHLIYTRYRKTGLYQISDPIMMIQSLTNTDEEIMGIFSKNRVFYNLLNIIIGDFDRGIIGLTQIAMSLFATNLLRSIEKREIPENPTSIESVLPAINKEYHEYIRKSYPLVDIDSHTSLIPQSQIEKIKSNMIDLYDIDGLRKISVDGLNLIELL